MGNLLFNPAIQTERLILRSLSRSDADALFRIFSNPDVMRYWNTAPWTSKEQAISYIVKSNEAQLQEESLTLGIFQKADNALIGKCMLFNFERESRRAEIGFGLDSTAWGQGFNGEAARALLEYAFLQMKLRRIEAEIDSLNLPSAKALERLGFSREGLLRKRWEIAGVVSDSILYGLLVDDWKVQQA